MEHQSYSSACRRRRAGIPTKFAAVAIVAALVAAGCGGSDESADAEPAASVTTAAAADTATDTADAEAESADAEPDEAPAQDVTWDDPNATELLEARMAELSTVFGGGMSAETVAAVFPEFPADFPYPEATVTGVFQEWSDDLRDEPTISHERIVGTDGASDEATLDAVDAAVASAGGRWSAASKQRQEDQNFNDLYTTDDGERLVLTGDIDLQPGEALLEISYEQVSSEIPVPSWAAGLPVPQGGQIIRVSEGVGVVAPLFAGPVGSGYIEYRVLYQDDAVEDLVSFLESGVLVAAGFEAADTPFNSSVFRQDLTIGDWEGSVLVGERSVDGEVVAHDVVWSLRRA